MRSGIYEIFNTVSGRQYIGSAVKFRKRWELHRRTLKNGKHHNVHLQRAWDKYGSDAFKFRVLERVEPERLIEREQHWMDVSNVVETGYNINPIAGSRFGSTMSEHQKTVLRKALKGKPLSPEHVQKIRESATGRKHSEETKRKLSRIKKSFRHTEEAKRKISEAGTGRPKSKATRAKLKNAWTPERRKAHSEMMKAEHADPVKAEARSKAQKAAWSRRKEG